MLLLENIFLFFHLFLDLEVVFLAVVWCCQLRASPHHLLLEGISVTHSEITHSKMIKYILRIPLHEKLIVNPLYSDGFSHRYSNKKYVIVHSAI